MPREGEELHKKRSLTEISSQAQQQDVLQNQNTAAMQGQLMQNATTAVNGGSVIQVIGADQFAPAPQVQFSGGTLDFSVRGSIECEDDSSRMKSIRAAVGSYFSKKNDYDSSAGGSMERARAARELIKEGEAIISECKWYCFFRHPFTKRGIARKEKVKALRAQVEDEIHSLKLETINIVFEKKNKEVMRGARKVGLRAKKNGEKELVFGGKEMTYEASDRIRLNQKDYLKALVAEDNRNRKTSWSREVRKLLRFVNDYADIHTTAMHVSSAERLSVSKNVSKEVNKKYSKKILQRREKLEREKACVCNILNSITSIDQNRLSPAEKEIIKRYRKFFVNMIRGTLEVDKNAETVDVTDKKDKIVFQKLRKEEMNVVKVEDQKGMPLFSHEPCTQDIYQRNLGDCYFLTTLSQIVKDDPGAIRSMMKDNGTSVTVRFFRANGNQPMVPVFVTVPKVKLSIGSRDTLWVQIMEMAYSAFMQNMDVKYHPEKARNIDKLDMGYVGNGGEEIDVFTAIYGEDKFGELGVDFPTLLDDEGLIDNTSHIVGVIASNSGETAILNDEEKKMTEKYGNFKELYLKYYNYSGELKKGADPKEAEFVRQYFEMNKELFDKRMKQNINALYDDTDDRYYVSFNEINEKLREKNEKWLKTVPEAKEILEKRQQLRKKLSKEQEGTEEYQRVKKELDSINKVIKEKKLNDWYIFATTDLIPGEAMINYTANKTRQISALNDDSNNLQGMIRKKLGIDMATNPSEAKNNYGKIIEAIRNIDYSEYKDKDILFTHMHYTPYFSDDAEKDRKEAFELVKLHALKSCEIAQDKITEIVDENKSNIFTGVYSQSVLDVYKVIKENVDSGKRLTADSRRMDNATNDLGDAGEKKFKGIADTHAYAIMDAGEFDFEGKKVLMVKLRNPWAGYTCGYTVDKKGKVVPNEDNNKTNGEFWMEMTHFTKLFFRVTYEK